MQAEFSIVIANTGETAAQESHKVYVSIDDEAPLEVEVIEPLEGGETTSLRFAQDLEPGRHKALVSVMDAEAELDVDARTAEISLEVLEHSIIEDGVTYVRTKASNGGELTAESVVLSVQWQVRPSEDAEVGNGMTSGSNETAAIIDKLEPGEDAEVAVPLQIPSGSYNIELAAYTETLEVTSDDNATQTTVDVEYVQLITSVEAIRHLGYANSGEGLVEVDLQVTNDGVGPGTDIAVGVGCMGEAHVGCSQMVNSDLIPPGDIAEITLSLTVPQGSTEAMAYAGALEDSYRWGHENVAEFVIEVPELPETRLSLELESSPRGEYWSDGTSNVDVAFSLRNEGYAEFEIPQPISFVCLREEQIVEGCGGEVIVSLVDGFGPETTESLMIRMPMGITLLEAEYGAEAVAQFEVEVPERILGVARDVWECFSDRPGIYVDEEGCGGWYPDTVVKWDPDGPIKVWATGDEEYIEVLEEVLDELSPLLNLQFERVETEDEADLKAYMGVTIEEAKAIGIYCEESAGCAWWEDYLGVVTRARLGVWHSTDWEYGEDWSDLGLIDQLIKSSTIHETLHALVPMDHRTEYLSVMNIRSLRLPTLSTMDLELIRINSHPLVKPNMTMDQVEELIVFEDELLDPPELGKPNGIEVVRRAYRALQDAGSVEYRIKGAWLGSGCDKEFGWAQMRVGDFRPDGPNLFALAEGSEEYYMLNKDGWMYWEISEGRPRKIDSQELVDITSWSPSFSNPLGLLVSILYFADHRKIEITKSSEGTLALSVHLDDWFGILSWSRSETVDILMVISEETYQIEEYSAYWRFVPHSSRACSRYEVESKEGRYGIEIQIPDAIREG